MGRASKRRKFMRSVSRDALGEAPTKMAITCLRTMTPYVCVCLRFHVPRKGLSSPPVNGSWIFPTHMRYDILFSTPGYASPTIFNISKLDEVIFMVLCSEMSPCGRGNRCVAWSSFDHLQTRFTLELCSLCGINI